jgi:hypothetical protein
MSSFHIAYKIKDKESPLPIHHSINIYFSGKIAIKSIALNKSTKTKFFQIVINVRPH